MLKHAPRVRGGALVKVSVAAGIALLCSSVACWSGLDASPERGSRDEQASVLGADPVVSATIPVRVRPGLRENSGVAMSRTQPGVLFTINDSGHDPVLFALDTAGNDRGAWTVSGAANTDWEAISLGSCGEAGPSGSMNVPPTCVYIGDVGDNDAQYRSREIYRLPEPAAGNGQLAGTVTPERLVFRFQDGPRDVEAMYVGPTGTIFLITKRPLKGRDGALRPARVYTIPVGAWERQGTSATATLADSLALIPGPSPWNLITDASISADARFVAVRTYAQVYVFSSDPASGRIRTDVPPSICNVTSLRERQGEGITWYGSSFKLLLTSEGRSSPLQVISCPLPAE